MFGRHPHLVPSRCPCSSPFHAGCRYRLKAPGCSRTGEHLSGSFPRNPFMFNMISQAKVATASSPAASLERGASGTSVVARSLRGCGHRRVRLQRDVAFGRSRGGSGYEPCRLAFSRRSGVSSLQVDRARSGCAVRECARHSGQAGGHGNWEKPISGELARFKVMLGRCARGNGPTVVRHRRRTGAEDCRLCGSPCLHSAVGFLDRPANPQTPLTASLPPFVIRRLQGIHISSRTGILCTIPSSYCQERLIVRFG